MHVFTAWNNIKVNNVEVVSGKALWRVCLFDIIYM